ncbi:type VI secretion system Vgr family protein [Kolteria novifilia]
MTSNIVDLRMLRSPLQGEFDDLSVLEVKGSEAVSQWWIYELTLVAPRDKRDRVEALLGEEVQLSIRVVDQLERRVQGIVFAIDHGESLEDKVALPDDLNQRFARCELTIVPKCSVLEMGRRSKITRQTSLDDLIATTLSGYDYAIELGEQGATYDYAAQYRESDWSHLRRRFEEEGIYYYFQSDGEREIIHISGTSLNASVVAALPLNEDAERRGPHILRWRESERSLPWKAAIHDRHHQRIDQEVTAWDESIAPVRFGSRTTRVDHDPMREAIVETREHVAQRFSLLDPNGVRDDSGLDGLERATARRGSVRRQQSTSGALRAWGVSDCVALRPGMAFDLTGAGESSGTYFITRTRNNICLPGPIAGMGSAEPYRCEFECIPIDVPFRPASTTPRPSIPGVQTATVVGHEPDIVTTAGDACVKIRLPWGSAADEESCWVRVTQKNAGPQHGTLLLPRVGQEVVVGFEGADPDRPIILGSLADAHHLPRESRSTLSHVDGISIRSERGTLENASGLLFDYRVDQEQLLLHSEKDMTWNAEEDQLMQSGGNFRIVVGGEQEARNDLLASVPDSSASSSLDSQKSTTGNFSLTVAGSLNQVTEGSQTTTNHDDYDLLVKGNSLLVVEGPVCEVQFSNVVITGTSWTGIMGSHQTFSVFRIRIYVCAIEWDTVVTPIRFRGYGAMGYYSTTRTYELGVMSMEGAITSLSLNNILHRVRNNRLVTTNNLSSTIEGILATEVDVVRSQMGVGNHV